MLHDLSVGRRARGTWLGMYGFGEFASLAGTNAYHNYTTALYAVFRKPVTLKEGGR